MSDADVGSSGTVDFLTMPPLRVADPVLTIGNFDGVHLGHQAVIKALIKKARQKGVPAFVLTFFPDPSDFFSEADWPYYLTTPSEKANLICGLGADRVFTLRFDRAFADLSPEAFLSTLKEKFDLSLLLVGQDFALGKNRQGAFEEIQALSHKLYFDLETMPKVNLHGQVISSTTIRLFLDRGKVNAAAELLGRPYRMDGVVTHGSDRGARIGLPTANLSHWPQKKSPGVGVYVTYAFLGSERLPAVTNVGVRPTFENQAKPNIETHILDFDGNIYGTKMSLAFVCKIRDEQKFSGVDDFLAQIENDKIVARKIFNDV
jgi:riboflavin kinase / FMN adenylyltransferase